MLELNSFGAAYRGRRVLVTGHTGFKGSWLSLWLHALGSRVCGLALDPPSHPNHWDLLQLQMIDVRADIRSGASVRTLFTSEQPEIVFHLAAQPLVRRSYREPIETWATNVMGTANVLEAARQTPSVCAVVVVTTDKCYENREWPWAYRESDRLGGHDPYSASKAGAELVAASYRSAFLDNAYALLLATARGGNVIGGGDWSEDRLVPDLVRAVTAGKPLIVRSPRAIRPWQHVLDCLSGYLQLGQRLLEGDRTCTEAWNFGPDQSCSRAVTDILRDLANHWPTLTWQLADGPQPHETTALQIDSAKARTRLGWRPIWNYEKAVQRTARWYRDWHSDGTVRSIEDLYAYTEDATRSGMNWA